MRLEELVPAAVDDDTDAPNDAPEERAPSETQYALDGDAYLGRDDTNRTLTYELEVLGGPLLLLVQQARATPAPVLYVNDATTSLLLINKCYGHEMRFSVGTKRSIKKKKKLGQAPAFEDLHVFSVFRQPGATAAEMAAQFDPTNTVYMPQYGGTAVVRHEECIPNVEHVLRPCVMDKDTRNLMNAPGLGWRSLMYVNKGEDDPLPTGLVALEGWHYAMPKKDAPATDGEANPKEEAMSLDSCESTDPAVIAQAFQGVINESIRIAEALAVGLDTTPVVQ